MSRLEATGVQQTVRVRIAPSPTGDPHVGTAYVALFNYVFAKKMGGSFVLRVEDTDQKRYRSTSEQQLYRSLRWLGLEWDEGPDVGGPFGPYKQSERKEIYSKYVERLLAEGKAYRCFCTAERLAEVRERKRQAKERLGYDRHCRDLDPVEAQKRAEAGESFVVRMKMPLAGECTFQDKLRGSISIPFAQLDDQVILKADGMPTYHLASVVDDHLMQISHVMRAEEWISSTPKHVVLYELFGWEQPTWVHLPLLRNSDKSKISKRKNPVSLTYYERAGILPQAMRNFLALMGWSYGDDVEHFGLDQMIDKFSLDQLHTGEPVFDMQKLTWMNKHYMQLLTEAEFVGHMREQVFSSEKLRELFPLVRERLPRFEDFVANHGFFFSGALDYADIPLLPKGMEKSVFVKGMKTVIAAFDELYEWNATDIQKTLDQQKAALGWKPRDLFMPVRLMATGRKDSPPLAESLEVLGRDMVRFRLRDALEKL